MNSDTLSLRTELKERFKRELISSEKIFFLKIAREAIARKGYQASEDLFYYCYFLTLKERLSSISPQRGEGYARLFLVEAKKDLEEEIKVYEERLEANKLPTPDVRGFKFIEFLSE